MKVKLTSGIAPALKKAEATLAKFGKRFPEVTEDYPWGHRTLKVRGKAFVFMSLEESLRAVAPKRIAALLEGEVPARRTKG